MTQLERVLEHSTRLHGFWLINNQGIIAGDVLDALNRDGYSKTLQSLRDSESDLVKHLYSKIDGAKS